MSTTHGRRKGLREGIQREERRLAELERRRRPPEAEPKTHEIDQKERPA